jgi:hypothetical protein
MIPRIERPVRSVDGMSASDYPAPQNERRNVWKQVRDEDNHTTCCTGAAAIRSIDIRGISLAHMPYQKTPDI